MSRRGDNIRKRKDGRWEARYVRNDPGPACGKYGSVYGKTYQEAKEKRALIIRQGRNKPPDKVLCFQDLLDAWQDANRIRLKASTVSRYQNLIDTHIGPALGNKRVCELSAAAINRFLNAKLTSGRLYGGGGLSPAYVRSITMVISSALCYGVSEKLCEPFSVPITKPALPKKDLDILSQSQQILLERELARDIDAEKLMIYITMYTGLRIGEACALRWEDIDLDEGIIYVRHTVCRVWETVNGEKSSRLIIGPPKTANSLRRIPVCSKLHDIIRNYPMAKTGGYILQGKDPGDFLSPRTFEYRYKKILKAANIDPIHYHALRHTFATRCIERGVDIKSLSEILGHANAAITLNTYVHSSMELKRLQLEKLSL